MCFPTLVSLSSSHTLPKLSVSMFLELRPLSSLPQVLVYPPEPPDPPDPQPLLLILLVCLRRVSIKAELSPPPPSDLVSPSRKTDPPPAGAPSSSSVFASASPSTTDLSSRRIPLSSLSLKENLGFSCVGPYWVMSLMGLDSVSFAPFCVVSLSSSHLAFTQVCSSFLLFESFILGMCDLDVEKRALVLESLGLDPSSLSLDTLRSVFVFSRGNHIALVRFSTVVCSLCFIIALVRFSTALCSLCFSVTLLDVNSSKGALVSRWFCVKQKRGSLFKTILVQHLLTT
ncbi:unnamed protein product [Cochlearia groenlandica]